MIIWDDEGLILFDNASFYGELIAFPPNPFNNEIDIDGIKRDGIVVPIFRKGEWVRN